MAAGSSAPELATVIIGVFFAKVSILLKQIKPTLHVPYFSGRHWSEWCDWIGRVQHHVCDQRVLSVFGHRGLPQLVAAGARLLLLHDQHPHHAVHHLRRSHHVVSCRNIKNRLQSEVTLRRFALVSRRLHSHHAARAVQSSLPRRLICFATQRERMLFVGIPPVLQPVEWLSWHFQRVGGRNVHGTPR